MDTILSQLETILIIAAFIAGFVDAIAGGGGLIIVPILMFTGMSPTSVLATSKLQASFGSAAASFTFARKGLVDIRKQWLPALICLVTSFTGARLVALLPHTFLEIALPIILIAVAIYFGVQRGLNDSDRTARLNPIHYALYVTPFIAFYDGIFGPGAGTFYMLGFVLLAGFGMTKATAHTKLLNFASNLGALIAFAMLGVVDWRLGIMMGIAQFLGAQLGANTAVKGGAKLIRPLLVFTSVALAVKLLLG